MCMAAEETGSGAYMMDEKDGTGDGEWGKFMWVMGTPMDDGTACMGSTADAAEAGGAGGGTGGMDAYTDGRIGGSEWISETTGTSAGRLRKPPYPGSPYCGNSGADGDGRLSTAARREEISFIWCWRP